MSTGLTHYQTLMRQLAVTPIAGNPLPQPIQQAMANPKTKALLYVHGQVWAEVMDAKGDVLIMTLAGDAAWQILLAMTQSQGLVLDAANSQVTGWYSGWQLVAMIPPAVSSPTFQLTHPHALTVVVTEASR